MSVDRALGVCYYPEHWPESEWAADARRMAETGLTWVRIGEFAWRRIEPEPGRFDFGWLDRAVDTLAGAGLKVVLGTPTATPPRWMLTRHPDMLARDAEGRIRAFGSRRHYCFSHAGYGDDCARIVAALAARYGAHPAVAAWQTDNEYGCHDTALSYSDAAAAAFRGWLARRYEDVAALNAAWGGVFWSMEYGDFAEIDPPNLTVTEPNPAHALDFRRFSSDQVAAFNARQCAIIRRHAPGRPILHNFMGRSVDFDHFRLGEDLDAASWDSYPLGFLEDRIGADDAWKRRFLRQGDPDFQAFHHDLYRAVGRGRFWVMEQQPGPVNWAPWNPAPMPGMLRLWAWEAFAHGAEALCWFRWRQAPFAQEQMHAGLLRPDGAPAPGLAEAAEVAREIAAAPAVATGPAHAALVFDYESVWGWAAQPQGRGFDGFALAFDFYRALRRAGLSVDILRPDAGDLGAYRLAAIPGLMRWRPAMVAALADFAGTALIGPRTGAKTRDFAIPARLPPDLPPGMLDLRVAHAESLRPNAPAPLARGGAFRLWREIVETGPLAEIRETDADGAPALIAQGGLRYLAGWPDRAALDRIVAEACAEAGLPVLNLPEGVRVRDAGDWRFAFNYNAEPVEPGDLGAGWAAAPATLAPGGVAMLRRR